MKNRGVFKIRFIHDRQHVKKSVELVERQKEILREGLTKLGFEVVPSAANFLLIKVVPHSGRDLFEKILQKGVIIRSVDEYGLPDYLRVTIGKPDENKIFLKALQEVLGKK